MASIRTFIVEWIERTPRWSYVEADSEEEAIRKAKAGEVVEGSQDSEPGRMDKRTVKVTCEKPLETGDG